MKTSLALLAALLLCGCAQEAKSPASNAPAPAAAPSPTKSSAPVVWKRVAEWAGSTNKKTEPFMIKNKPWRIQWGGKALKGGANLLQVSVLRTSDGDLVQMPGNVANRNSVEETSYVYEAGEFAIDVNCVNAAWAVIVEQPE